MRMRRSLNKELIANGHTEASPLCFYSWQHTWIRPMLCLLAFITMLPALPSCLASTTIKAQITHLPQSIQKSLQSTWPRHQIHSKSYYLSEEEHTLLAQLNARSTPRRIHTFYSAYQKGSQNVEGYGIFDTHIVRSKTQTLFFHLKKDASIKEIRTIAFHEPNEYKAPQRWLMQFQRQQLKPKEKTLERSVDALSGATLTRRSVIHSAIKVLYLYKTHIKAKDITSRIKHN